MNTGAHMSFAFHLAYVKAQNCCKSSVGSGSLLKLWLASFWDHWHSLVSTSLFYFVQLQILTFFKLPWCHMALEQSIIISFMVCIVSQVFFRCQLFPRNSGQRRNSWWVSKEYMAARCESVYGFVRVTYAICKFCPRELGVAVDDTDRAWRPW